MFPKENNLNSKHSEHTMHFSCKQLLALFVQKISGENDLNLFCREAETMVVELNISIGMMSVVTTTRFLCERHARRICNACASMRIHADDLNMHVTPCKAVKLQCIETKAFTRSLNSCSQYQAFSHPRKFASNLFCACVKT